MTSADFVRGFLGLLPEPNYDPKSVTLLGGIADTSKDGYLLKYSIYDFHFFQIQKVYKYYFCNRFISFPEFQAFEGLLCLPDALYLTAFQLFDIKGSGMVEYGMKLVQMLFSFSVMCNNTFLFNRGV